MYCEWIWNLCGGRKIQVLYSTCLYGPSKYFLRAHIFWVRYDSEILKILSLDEMKVFKIVQIWIVQIRNTLSLSVESVSSPHFTRSATVQMGSRLGPSIFFFFFFCFFVCFYLVRKKLSVSQKRTIFVSVIKFFGFFSYINLDSDKTTLARRKSRSFQTLLRALYERSDS